MRALGYTKAGAFKRWLWRVGSCLVLVFLLWLLPWVVRLPEGLSGPLPESPVITDRHGVPMARLVLPTFQRASPVGLEEVPADLVACTLAAEDKRFWKHGGVDVLATVRAAWDMLRTREVVSGASTVTQQLIKISSPSVERTVGRKFYESLAAIQLERRWTKREILTAYLNRLDYGNRSIGVAEAARFYFQKPLGDLSLSECALLAGLPQGPSMLNPLKHPQRAMKRRKVVLERAEAAGWIDAERVKRALSEPMGLHPLRTREIAPWLKNVSLPDGAVGRVRSTLDAALQKDVEAIVREEVNRLRHANLRHAAVVVLDNRTAEILALVSSADWSDPRGGQINGAFAPRSPGSALKPFTYLLALGQGQRSSVSLLADVPSPFRTPQGVDLPQNYDRAYRGPVMLRDALACSLNVPALRELNRLGGPRELHRLLTCWGLDTLGEDPEAHGLGLTLGNAPVRLIELVGAYATLARGGIHLVPGLFATGDAVANNSGDVSREDCLVIADILADATARAPAFPPGGPLDLPFPCAVKTGTSSDFRDNWCVGFTRDFTVGVWAGNFENQPMKEISGVAGAAPIFQRVMLRLHKNHKPSWWERPEDWVEVKVDPRNGKQLADERGNPRRVWLPKTHVPPVAAASDYDEEGRALLDETFAGWFESPHNFRRGELALHERAPAVVPLRILRPAEGTEFLLDPEMPSSAALLHPLTDPAGVVRWSSETLRVEDGPTGQVIHLAPGTHTLHALDTRSGKTRQIAIRVRSL
jgi:penicillin-binding protein 1C